MKVLDLYCGAGGAAMGIHQALEKANIVHSIVGHDSNMNVLDEYPFDGKWSDVLQLTPEYLATFDFIWASPPCQGYSWGTVKWRNQGKKYPDLVGKTRELLLKGGKPFVMENVVGSPLRKDLKLCGEMFGLHVIRHRVFEVNGFAVLQPMHSKHRLSVWQGTAVGVWSGGKPGCFGNEEHRKYYATVAGHGGDGGRGNCTLKAWQDAMGIDWVKRKDSLKECVPPAYSKYIMGQFLKSKGEN
jgi:DNA (cytosine-5)-methyltransferase 1